MENILSLIPPKGTAVSKRYAVAYKMSFLLSSRLYCWLRILTVSAGHDAFRPTFEHSVLPLFVLRRVVDSSLRRVHSFLRIVSMSFTTSREFHPAPKNLPLCILYIVIPIFPKIKSFLEFYIFSNLHRKSDAFLCHIDGKHLHIDNVTDADSL